MRYAGEDEPGTVRLDDERRDWNRLSKGLKDGVGLWRPGLEATDGNMLLPPGEETTDPYTDYQQHATNMLSNLLERMGSRLGLIA